jgi:antitoxin component YwqK of YwqJK toxin-antitoxin module
MEIRKGYHKNGNLYYEGSYVNEVSHGLQKWYKDGRRDYILQLKKDQANGPRITFNY